MRIKRCHIDAFGPLCDATFDDLDHPVVVVEGPNESGKTTFLEFFRTMFYGIYPVDADQHLYLPARGRALGGELTFSLENGDDIVVQRRLLGSPQGRLLNGAETDLGNATVPMLQHIPRALFESVYALSQADMVALDGQAWEEIQDRLLGRMNFKHIRPAREVILLLEEEARALWRNDEQGRPLARQLNEQRKSLRKLARKARKDDERLRTLVHELASHDQAIARLEEEKINLKAERRKAERTLPVRSLLDKIEALRSTAGDLSRYEDIPDEPQKSLDEMATEVRGHEERLEAARNEEKNAKKKVRELTLHLLEVPLHDELKDLVQAVPEVELRNRVEVYQEAVQNLREMQMYAERLFLKVVVSKSMWPWFGVIGLGILMIVMGLVLLDMTLLWALGIAVVAFGGLQCYEVWSHNRRIELDDTEAPPEIEGFKREVRRRRLAISDLLRGLPLPQGRMDSPDLDFVKEIKELKEALDENDRLARQVEEQEDDAVKKIETIQSRKKAIESRLVDLGDGSVVKGIEELTKRRKASVQALHFEETLQQEYPEWHVAAQAGASDGETMSVPAYSEEDLLRIEARIEKIEDELREETTARIEKEKEIDALNEGRPVDTVESEIAHLEAMHLEIKRRRDRLLLLANLLRRADQSYRLKHQPEVVRIAGSFIHQITGGRYERLILDEATGTLYICEKNLDPQPVKEPISRGARDQMYLAFRLAIMEHLDRDHERVPAFFDELFVNWDAQRRRHGYDLLKEISAHRQVFLFTCHAWQAQEMAKHLKAHRVQLASEPQLAT